MFSDLGVGLHEVPFFCGRQFLDVRFRAARGRFVRKFRLEQDLLRREAFGELGTFSAGVCSEPGVNIYRNAGI